MSKSEQSAKTLLLCIIAFGLLAIVAWAQTNGYLPKY